MMMTRAQTPPLLRPALLAAGLLLASLAAPSSAFAQEQEQQITPVGVDRVVEAPFNQTMPVLGRLVANRAGVVAARINGPVKAFLVEVGDRIDEGDPIAELVDDALSAQRDLWQAELSESRGAVGTRQAELKLRRQEMKRFEKLKDSAAFNPAQLDDKRQEVAIIESEIGEQKAAVSIAEANLRLAEINLYNAVIRAPYAGVVAERHTEVGAYLQVGASVVTLIDDGSLEIEADVPTDRVQGLVAGAEIAYGFTDGTAGTAVVRAVIPDENPLTRTRSVRFTGDFGGKASLAANQSVTLYIPVGAERTVLTVHKDAILERGGRRLVVLANSGAAEFRPVTIGEAVGERFEVTGGLSAGDLVVVRGNERLQPGQPIAFDAPQG